MRKFIFFIVAVIGLSSCTRSVKKNSMPSGPVIYENELFSVEIPEGWVCDSSEWYGLDAQKNVVKIYHQYKDFVRFHFVKTFMPFQWENIDEAKEMAKMARAISGDSVELIREIDSIEVGGYPSCILYFANYVDRDTIIQKQFVTYLHDSHIMMYFNELFPVHAWDEAQEFGDAVISTIKLKKVVNPLEDKDAMKKAIEEGMKNNVVNEKYMKRGEQLMEEMQKNE